MTSNKSTTAGIITFSYGGRKFVDLAISLAQSLVRSSPDIPRASVTDSNDSELATYFDLIIPVRREWGADVYQKLHIDQ